MGEDEQKIFSKSKRQITPVKGKQKEESEVDTTLELKNISMEISELKEEQQRSAKEIKKLNEKLEGMKEENHKIKMRMKN